MTNDNDQAPPDDLVRQFDELRDKLQRIVNSLEEQNAIFVVAAKIMRDAAEAFDEAAARRLSHRRAARLRSACVLGEQTFTESASRTRDLCGQLRADDRRQG